MLFLKQGRKLKPLAKEDKISIVLKQEEPSKPYSTK
jgi:hypothetical protein